MSGPQPPYPQNYLRKPSVGSPEVIDASVGQGDLVKPSVGSPEIIDASILPAHLSAELVQKGGPVSVATGSYSAAFTFGVAFPDTAYQAALEWVSGSSPAYGIREKTANYAYAVFPQVTEDSAFQWRCWRLP